jgi:hypothetical protein
VKGTTGACGPLLEELLGSPREALGRPIREVREWRAVWEKAGTRWNRPIQRAIFAGLSCDRLAWAFASGYQAAIRCLYPHLPEGIVAAMCISESGGNHPRAIHTRVTATDRGYLLDGEKRFITGGETADRLAVAASMGVENGRNVLRMAWVNPETAGVALSTAPPLPFIPELTHCSATFRQVFIPSGNLLPGDGYAEAVKPFRTIEDLHVTGAVLGHLLGIARRCGWPRGIVGQMTLLVAAVVSLAEENPRAPAVHVAMGGLLEQVDLLLDTLDPLWPGTGAAIHRRWQRDRPVLAIAARARQQRLEAAWRDYGGLSKGS